jgi:hypothetical protein
VPSINLFSGKHQISFLRHYIVVNLVTLETFCGSFDLGFSSGLARHAPELSSETITAPFVFLLFMFTVFFLKDQEGGTPTAHFIRKRKEKVRTWYFYNQ